MKNVSEYRRKLKHFRKKFDKFKCFMLLYSKIRKSDLTLGEL